MKAIDFSQPSLDTITLRLELDFFTNRKQNLGFGAFQVEDVNKFSPSYFPLLKQTLNPKLAAKLSCFSVKFQRLNFNDLDR